MTEPSTAVQRVTEFTDVWLDAPGRDAIERIHADRVYELRGSDVREVLRELAEARAQLAGLTEEWAFQYVSYGVTETSLVCESREEAEREAGRHRRGDRIVHRPCGEWEVVEPQADDEEMQS